MLTPNNVNQDAAIINSMMRFMQENGLTQAEFAELAGISPVMVSIIKNKKQRLTRKMADKINVVIGTLSDSDMEVANEIEDTSTDSDDVVIIDDGIKDDFDEEKRSIESRTVKPEITQHTVRSASRFSREIIKVIGDSAIDMGQNGSKASIRFMVDSYYQYQNNRIANDNRIRSIEQGFDSEFDARNTEALRWLSESNYTMEKTLKKILEKYVLSTKVGRWLNDIVGIGPVISAGLISYFEPEKWMKTFNSFCSYAGLNDNNVKWLGTKKAILVVKEEKEKLSAICEKRAKKFTSLSGTDHEIYSKILKKLVKEHWSELFHTFMASNDKWFIRSEVLKYTNDEMFADTVLHDIEVYEYNGSEVFYNTVQFLFDHTHPSVELMVNIAKRLNRSYKNVFNGAYDNNAYCRTYSRLEAFLAMPPYNRTLKKLCYKIADSFVKKQKNSMYGQLYLQRKEYETKKNEKGEYASEAARCLEEYSFKNADVIATLKSGRLTPGHIDMRARRWVEKIFISHLFDAMYIDKFGMTPELPPVFNMGGHIDWIEPEVPYSKYWKYEDNRNYGSISRSYSPNYTYHYGATEFHNENEVLEKSNIETKANEYMKAQVAENIKRRKSKK